MALGGPHIALSRTLGLILSEGKIPTCTSLRERMDNFIHANIGRDSMNPKISILPRPSQRADERVEGRELLALRMGNYL